MRRKEPANSNVLAGMECPSCGSRGPFTIRCECTACVFDDGVEDATEFEWGDEDYCKCRACGACFTVKDFLVEPNRSPAAGAPPAFTRDDWRADVVAGNTALGYDAWLAHTLEALRHDYETGAITAEEYEQASGRPLTKAEKGTE